MPWILLSSPKKAAYETILVGVLTQEANLNASRLAIAEQLQELQENVNATIQEVAEQIAAIQEQKWVTEIMQVRQQWQQNIANIRTAFYAYLNSIQGVNCTGDNFDDIAASGDSADPNAQIYLNLQLAIVDYTTVKVLQIKNNLIRAVIAEAVVNTPQIAVVVSPSNNKRQASLYTASATVTSPSSSSPSTSPSGNMSTMYAIIGGVVGGVVLLVIIIVVIVVVKKSDHNDSV